MKLLVIAVGNRMPKWVEAAVSEYQKRFPRELKLEFREIAPERRDGRGSEARAMELEAKQILAALPKRCHVVALDERGKQYSSEELAGRVEAWESLGCDIALVVGGPNGLTDEVRSRADELWSLSRLTLPHPLVRVFLAETLYRAWSISAGLPYHRA
ncbi:MAG: 23S rRNA (pseudouridine(1915)-N(3))-methyltransferase RlmH [Succinivibrio sp.]|nr:23S rRNA (pseudouridine(1915)-N(3))-methyltransferase RlmH [Succinivibrio sp.]